MRPKQTKTSKSSNLSSYTTKTLGSPTFKENANTVSSKYSILLKSKRDSGSKQKILYALHEPGEQLVLPMTLNRTVVEPESNTSFTRAHNRLSRDKSAQIANQFTELETPSHNVNLAILNNLKCNERDPGKSKNHSKGTEGGFRSPPVAHKSFTANVLTNTYQSNAKTMALASLGKREGSPTNHALIFGNASRSQLPMNGKSLGSPPRNQVPVSSLQNSGGLGLSGLLTGNQDYDGPLFPLGSNIFVNSFCVNHRDKKIKFILKESSRTEGQLRKSKYLMWGFCSKCAVSLVKAGLECDEIEVTDLGFALCNCLKAANGSFCAKCLPPVNKFQIDACEPVNQSEFLRKKRIANFIDELIRQKETCLSTVGALTRRRQALLDTHEAQTQELNAYFTEIYNFLEERKLKAISQLDKNLQTSRSILEDYITLFNDGLKEFDIIYSDIDENYQRIVTKIELGPFNNILNKYQEKLREFLGFVAQVESLQLASSSLTFGSPFVNIQHNFDPRVQVSLKTAHLIESKKLDLEESKREGSFTEDNDNCVNSVASEIINEPELRSDGSGGSENFKSRRLEEGSKSDVYISFDQNNSTNRLIDIPTDQDLRIQEGESEWSGRGSRTAQKFNEALQKIIQAQNEQETFYNQFLKQNIHSDFRKTLRREPEEIEQPSVIESEERVFELDSRTDNDGWEQKQTPDLGEKQSPPEHIISHLRAINQNGVLSEHFQQPKLTCQKVLFKEL